MSIVIPAEMKTCAGLLAPCDIDEAPLDVLEYESVGTLITDAAAAFVESLHVVLAICAKMCSWPTHTPYESGCPLPGL
jgi:hypothetical protein